MRNWFCLIEILIIIVIIALILILLPKQNTNLKSKEGEYRYNYIVNTNQGVKKYTRYITVSKYTSEKCFKFNKESQEIEHNIIILKIMFLVAQNVRWMLWCLKRFLRFKLSL